MSCEITGVHATAEVVSTHRTSEGWLSYVRCHCGQVSLAMRRRFDETPTLRHQAA